MYKPEFKGPIQGWAINYIRINFWRIEATMTFEDARQEAYLVFMRCVKKCPSCEEPQQFMALFKRAFVNEMNDMASNDTKHRAQAVSQDADQPGSLENDGYLAILIREAPSEVKAVLNLFLSAPIELLDMALGSSKLKDGRRTVNRSKRICRMLGLDESIDVLQMVEDHFLDGR